MISLDETEMILNEIAESFPGGLMNHLNGGIILLPDAKLHRKSMNNDLYILGEYHHDRLFGRYIIIYYGSFMKVHGSLQREALKEKLCSTLKHEFVHHLESLAGEKDLEIKDAEQIAGYIKSSANFFHRDP